MHSINLLEQRLHRYKTKKSLLYALIALGMVMICYSGYLYYKHTLDSKPMILKKHLGLIINSHIDIIEPYLTLLRIPKANPTLNRIALQTQEIIGKIESIKNTQSNNSTQTPQLNTSPSQPTPTLLDVPRVPKKVNLNQASAPATLIDIMKRFNQSHDPNDSLFLAENYFDNKEYDKAIFWAIETNKITEEIEESWLIMVKSKYFLGDKNEAIRILRAYIGKTGSQNAQALLSDIINNKEGR